MLYHGDRVFRIFFPGKTKPRLVAGKAYRKTVVLRQPRRGQTQMPARARRSNSPTARPASPRRKCTNWLRALRRINAPAVPGRHERRKSEWCRQPNLRTASLQPCVPGAARHLACGASADTAHRNGSSDGRPGWPAGTPPRATVASDADAVVAAGEARRSRAWATRPVFTFIRNPVQDRPGMPFGIISESPFTLPRIPQAASIYFQ